MRCTVKYSRLPPTFLKAILSYFTASHLQICTCQSLSSQHKTIFLFSLSYDQLQVFLWTTLLQNHSYNNLCSFISLGCFNACHLKRPATLSLDALNDHDWSFCFFVSQTADDPVLYETITTQKLSALSSIHIISEEQLMLCFSSCQQDLVYSSWNLLKPL